MNFSPFSVHRVFRIFSCALLNIFLVSYLNVVLGGNIGGE